jgi:two-component system CheB/CheR fusion protein
MSTKKGSKKQNTSTSSSSQSSHNRQDGPSHYVGIGASAGGLEAIESFFKNMPADSGLAFIVVQHLSPDYKSLMVELLSKKTTMTVLRAQDGMEVKPDHVYLIPPKKELTIFHGTLLLKEQQMRNGINLPIDIFLRSLAEDQAERAVGIVLSGTGSDGTRGVRAIKEFNGMVMVQDEESARFDGMPRAAISTGVADFVLPPAEMPKQLMLFVTHPYEARRRQAERMVRDEDGLTRIFAMLREKTKVDFTFYKPSTITRRLERRMTVCQTENLDEYVDYLYRYPGELMILYRELLIGVTSFFRDPEAMNALQSTCLPGLLEGVQNREARFWVAGCSTGEEAYTLAIMAREVMEQMSMSRDVKIFATDLDRDAVMTAGNGIYPESIAADLNPTLLSKYFYRKDENYQIVRSIREMVVFAQHNLVKDPPFTNIDLVSCRNLLIYMQPVLQNKALKMFNFSLKRKGVLFLGSSETVGEMSEYFHSLDQKHKIFEAQGKASPPQISEVSAHTGGAKQKPGTVSRQTHTPAPAREDAWMLSRFMDLLSRTYVPLSLVVNEQMEIQHTLGDTEGFFKLPSGRAVNDISKMAAKDLAIPLTTGLQKVFRTGREIVYTNIPLKNMHQADTVTLRIQPLPEKKGHERLAAVFLEVIKEAASAGAEESPAQYDVSEEAQSRIRDLESELQFTKENLQATIEELETANEELQATNEELLASNEELQSTNEELQSTNEELHTVNAEYQNKINELTELNNDVDNLLTSSRIGTMLIDENLEIRRYSPEVTNIFKVLDKDVGRPVTHIAHELVDIDPVAAIKTVQDSDTMLEKQVCTKDGTWYLMRILPYHIGPRTFSGFVITFVDVTELQRAKTRLDESNTTAAEIIHHMPAGLFIYTLDEDNVLRLESGNPAAGRLTGIDPAQWTGKSFDEIWPQAREQGLTQKFIDVVTNEAAARMDKVSYADERVEGTFRIQSFALPQKRLAVSFENIADLLRLERDLDASEARYRHLFDTMAQGVVYQAADGRIISVNPSAERILGLSLDQMKGRTSRDPRWQAMREDGTPLPGEEHPSMVSLTTGEPVYGFIMGVTNPDIQGTRWIMVNATPQFRQGEQSPFQVYTTFEDITSRIESEKEITRTKERLDYAFDVAGLAWWEWYPATDTVNASCKKAEMIGLTPEETGDTLSFWTTRIHPDDYEKAMDAMRRHLRGDASSYEVVYRMQHRNGTYVSFQDRGRIIERDEDGTPRRLLGTVAVCAHNEDSTERSET